MYIDLNKFNAISNETNVFDYCRLSIKNNIFHLYNKIFRPSREKTLKPEEYARMVVYKSRESGGRCSRQRVEQTVSKFFPNKVDRKGNKVGFPLEKECRWNEIGSLVLKTLFPEQSDEPTAVTSPGKPDEPTAVLVEERRPRVQYNYGKDFLNLLYGKKQDNQNRRKQGNQLDTVEEKEEPEDFSLFRKICDDSPQQTALFDDLNQEMERLQNKIESSPDQGEMIRQIAIEQCRIKREGEKTFLNNVRHYAGKSFLSEIREKLKKGKGSQGALEQILTKISKHWALKSACIEWTPLFVNINSILRDQRLSQDVRKGLYLFIKRNSDPFFVELTKYIVGQGSSSQSTDSVGEMASFVEQLPQNPTDFVKGITDLLIAQKKRRLEYNPHSLYSDVVRGLPAEKLTMLLNKFEATENSEEIFKQLFSKEAEYSLYSSFVNELWSQVKAEPLLTKMKQLMEEQPSVVAKKAVGELVKMLIEYKDQFGINEERQLPFCRQIIEGLGPKFKKYWSKIVGLDSTQLLSEYIQEFLTRKDQEACVQLVNQFRKMVFVPR